MLIRERLAHKRPVFSFEFFPPKTENGEAVLWRSLEQLAPLQPDFVSVTYGAGGSTRTRTLELVARIKRELGIEPMAHLTCVGATRDELARTGLAVDPAWSARARQTHREWRSLPPIPVLSQIRQALPAGGLISVDVTATGYECFDRFPVPDSRSLIYPWTCAHSWD